MTTSHGTTFTAVTLTSPDPPALARFYEKLLGWTITTNEPDWVVLTNPQGGIGLSFQLEDLYVPPVWPAKPGEQQMMMHLEIRVHDLPPNESYAVERIWQGIVTSAALLAGQAEQ